MAFISGLSQSTIVSIVAMFFSAFSFLFSIINLILLRSMISKTTRNGYFVILGYMAISQILFDLAYFSNIVITDDSLFDSMASSFQDFSGLAVSFWTNFISFVTFYVVINNEPFDVFGNLKCASFLIWMPTVIMGCIRFYLMITKDSAGLEIYCWTNFALRDGSILVNFIILMLIRRRIVQMRSSGSDAEKTPSQVAIEALSKRMLLYPVMQLAVQLPVSVYEYLYGFGEYSGNTSSEQFIVAIATAISEPSAGSGYLLVFLIMQPNAYNIFKGFCCCSKLRLSGSESTYAAVPGSVELDDDAAERGLAIPTLAEPQLENIIQSECAWSLPSSSIEIYSASTFSDMYGRLMVSSTPVDLSVTSSE